MKPFDDPEAGRTKIPDDVEAFLAEVESRASKATPGPWEAQRGHQGRFYIGAANLRVYYCERAEDADFIAHSRTDVPHLITIIREYQRNHAFMLREWEHDAKRANAAEAERDELSGRVASLEAFEDRLNALKTESEKAAERCDSTGAHETATSHYGHASAYMRARQEFSEMLAEKGDRNG